jgi:hypothetical protein
MEGRDEQRARTWRMWPAVAGCVSALTGVLLATGTIFAQGLPIETSPGPTRQSIRVEPYRPPDIPARLPEAALYPRDVGVRLDPGFIEPLVTHYQSKTGDVRLGLSGFSAPNVPVVGAQSGASEVNGWLSLGFSLTWRDRQ